MFALHETTRKRICRGAFFALCVVPALATTGWIASLYLPGRTAKIARELGAALDAEVNLVDWRSPRPRWVRVTGMTLAEQASGQSLAGVKGLTAHVGGSSFQLTADEVVIEAARLAELAAKVRHWLSKLPSARCDIRIARLATTFVGNTTAEVVLSNVQGHFERGNDGGISGRLSGAVRAANAAAPTTVTVVFQPQGGDADGMTLISLLVKGPALPAAALGDVVLGFADLGPQARFEGEVQWPLERSAPAGTARGRLKRVELGGLLPAGSPHTLSANADVELTEWTWRGERVVRLAASVRAEDGVASRSLISAVYEPHLWCRGRDGALVADGSDQYELDLLAFHFELDARGLLFRGECPATPGVPDGCIAVSGGRPLLIEPPYEEFQEGFRFHLGHLIQALAPPAAISLPASREAVDMAERLPLPGTAGKKR